MRSGRIVRSTGSDPRLLRGGSGPLPSSSATSFPSDWRILLATPRIPAVRAAVQRVDIFRTHCPVPVEEVRALCHEILMRMLPGIVERDLDLFGSSVNAVQGLGFKKVELGLQPDEVPALIETVRSAGAAGAG